MAARADYVTKKDLEAFATKKDLEAVRDVLQADIRAIGIMFEQSRSEMKAVAELVLGCASKTDVQALETRLGERISLLESAVRDNSKDIRTNSADIRKNTRDIRKNTRDVRKNTTDVGLLRNEIAQLRVQFDRRDVRADELERRVADVEKRLG